jgi:15-cis-phytoene synthase
MSLPSMGEALLPVTSGVVRISTNARAIRDGQRQARTILARGSKSFALAGALLGAGIRQDAAVLYAWCRQADDRIDLAQSVDRSKTVGDLRRELDTVYGGRVESPLLVALHALIVRTRLPRDYFDALIDGFAMDASGERYATVAALDLYAYRVAGVVGLMMCHVLGVRDSRCVARAAHLGMAMQLTNICRDVIEDWQAGRQYLPLDNVAPDEMCMAVEQAPATGGARTKIAQVVAALLDRADAYYESGMQGLRDLGWRNALAIGAAARIYRAIGRQIARQHFDVFAGRVVVSLPAKLGLAIGSLWSLLLDLPRRWRTGKGGVQLPRTTVRYGDVQSTA